MNNIEDFENKKTTMNFIGDLKMLGYWRQFTEQDEFIILRKTKGGMYILQDKNGKETPSVAKKNINALWE